jgi:Zn-finger nucleic acid-binding protein
MSDEKDRLGQALYNREKAIEDNWARQRDQEIIAKLRERYTKPIKCPTCGEQLEAHCAIGLGGMSCPKHHGAWLPSPTLEALRARLANAAAAHHEGVGEKIFEAVQEIVDGLLKIHPKDIPCPECNSKLEARAAVAYGSIGLGGMACPNQHGAWLDHVTMEKIRGRLDSLEAKPAN